MSTNNSAVNEILENIRDVIKDGNNVPSKPAEDDILVLDQVISEVKTEEGDKKQNAPQTSTQDVLADIDKMLGVSTQTTQPSSTVDQNITTPVEQTSSEATTPLPSPQPTEQSIPDPSPVDQNITTPVEQTASEATTPLTSPQPTEQSIAPVDQNITTPVEQTASEATTPPPSTQPTEQSIPDPAPSIQNLDQEMQSQNNNINGQVMTNKESILSEEVLAQTSGAIQNLISAAESKNNIQNISFQSGATMEQLVKDLIKPMLQDWLNKNLTEIVQKTVEKEIKKIVS